ncbi:MAG: L-seryl-tRNA(Sec) selenium transferase, partial [Anaerolineaceae bacterium]|nr:L-seryl-tRNA(Sec) selenium transferase [Anaerolineaceae bacterium]
SDTDWIARVQGELSTRLKPSLVRVINASGVVLHTNLGRAPLCTDALKAIEETALGYSNLEFDLNAGKRGSRETHARDLLCQLTGAEDGLVVNNNAAAVLLCLSALARRQAVVISRSQLVEIGGGFRIPDVMKQSGARLIEVGTTNRTRLEDYENALKDGAAMVMRAHSSNFKLIGFTSQPAIAEMATLAHQYDVPLLDDLGSGALLPTDRYGLAHEPMVQESIQAGADLVCFSGDKLLGGPQAGIILGKSKWITRIKHHPLARAIRADKLCLAALSATLRHYLIGDVEQSIPVWRMISTTPASLKQRAENWQQELNFGQVIPSQSTVGGGSLPEEMLPSFVLALDLPHADSSARKLRQAEFPVIGRVQDGRLLLDPRTVAPDEEDLMLHTLKTTLIGESK